MPKIGQSDWEVSHYVCATCGHMVEKRAGRFDVYGDVANYVWICATWNVASGCFCSSPEHDFCTPKPVYTRLHTSTHTSKEN